jgi:hypothetical protein
MADDMRQAVSRLDWVKGVSVVLGEHMYADKINAGLAEGRSFEETFGAEADGNLDDLRQTFLVKAFQRRQVALLSHLIALGQCPGEIVSLTLTELGCLPLDDVGDKLVQRYLERRAVVGTARDDASAFVDAKGARLQADGLAGYVANLRRVVPWSACRTVRPCNTVRPEIEDAAGIAGHATGAVMRAPSIENESRPDHLKAKSGMQNAEDHVAR